MKAISAFMNIEPLLKRCKEFSAYIWGRWDVPHDEWVPADLRDKTAILPFTKDRRSIVSQVLPHELLDLGFYNPVLVWLVGWLPALAVLCAIPMAITSEGPRAIAWATFGATSLVGAIFITWLMAQCREKLWTIFKTLCVGYLLPLVGMFVSMTAPRGDNVDLSAILTQLTQKLGLIGVVLAVAVLLWFVISYALPRASKPLSNAIRFGCFGALFITVAAILHPVLAFPACVLVAALAPIRLTQLWDMEPKQWQMALGTAMNGEALGKLMTGHIRARHDQAVRASKDPTPLFTFGTSTGALYEKGDVFAADRGLPLVASLYDISTHMLVVGGTGRGKTLYALNRITTEWMAMNQGGMLFIDPKGEGALKYKHLPGYRVIAPTVRDALTNTIVSQGVNVGLIQGMEPGTVCQVLAEVGGVGKDSKSQGNAQYFINNGLNVGFHAEQLLWWTIKTHEHQVKIGRKDANAKINWRWTLHDIAKMVDLLAKPFDKSGRHDAEILTDMIETVQEWAPIPRNNPVLARTISFIKSELPVLQASEETWSSIVSTVKQWFTPLLNSNDLLSWAMCEQGDVDMGDVLHGAKFGLYLPLRYGTAGVMAMALIRRRIAMDMRKRPDNWRELDPTATPVLFVFDEFQELINLQDLEILSMGRSLGNWMVMATQSEAAIRQKLGDTATEALMNNFLSWMAFDVDLGTFLMLQKKVGKCWRKQLKGSAVAVDLDATTDAIASHPAYDLEHPNAGRRWDHMAAEGVGLAVPQQVAYRNAITKDSRNESFNESMNSFADNNLLTPFVTKGGSEEQEILDIADFNLLAKGEGDALIQINRGGVPRRDIVKMTPYHIPTVEEFNDLCATYTKQIEELKERARLNSGLKVQEVPTTKGETA